jgi:hypothetical protein
LHTKYFIEKIKGVGIVLEATAKARRCGITMETAGTAKTGTEYEPSWKLLIKVD